MRQLFIYILSSLVFFSCSKEADDFLPYEKFKVIFADAGEGVDYTPIDLIETRDNGFLILAEGALNSVYVLKTNDRGQLLWSATLPANYENPVGDIVFKEGLYYFIASRQNDQTAVLIEIDDDNRTVSPTQRSYEGYRRPLAFGAYDNEQFLMLNYNDTTGPVLSKIQDGFAMEWARNFDDAGGRTQEIDAALSDGSFHFFVGNINNGESLFFNAIRSSGATLTYTDDQGIASGKISGGADGAIVSYTYIGNLNTAINYVSAGQAYFQLAHSVAINDSTGLRELEGNLLPDFNTMGLAQTVNEEQVATDFVVNLYSTADNRMKWSRYNIGSEDPSLIDYIGGQDPQQFVKAIRSADGGLVVLYSVTFGGSRKRIAIQKIPLDDLRGI